MHAGHAEAAEANIMPYSHLISHPLVAVYLEGTAVLYDSSVAPTQTSEASPNMSPLQVDAA
jgi:hypothetical protein